MNLFKKRSTQAEAEARSIRRWQGVIEFDLDGKILDVNDVFLAAVGYGRSEVIGQHHSIFVPAEERITDGYRQFWADLKAGKAFQAQFARVAKGDRRIWLQATYTPICGTDGNKPFKVIKYATDITAIKEAVSNAEGQLAAVRKSQAVIEFMPDGEIITANDHFLDAMGYRLEELKGKNHRMFLPSGSDGDAEYEAMWSDLRSNKPMLGDILRYGKGGSRVYLNASYNPITDDSGRVVKVVKFANDVSDRVSAVTQIADALQKLASGDLECKIASTFSGTFEPMRSNFNETVDQLSSALGAVSRSASVIEMGAKEIAQASNDLSRRTEQQAAALEETAAALDEITVNVANASKRADEARSATEDASRSARQSAQVVTQAIGAMDKIEQSSKEISNIISVIDEIAFQTNLLALNAGVEAARAGEAGKGFAVVAQEVRELAQRSAKAAKEINQLIKSSSDEVKTGVKLVAETGVALEGIQNNVASVNEHMTAIAGAAKEQAIGLSEVNSAVNQLDQVTQQNAAMVEESTAASNALLNETEGLRQSLSRFAKTPNDKPVRGLPRLIATAS